MSIVLHAVQVLFSFTVFHSAQFNIVHLSDRYVSKRARDVCFALLCHKSGDCNNNSRESCVVYNPSAKRCQLAHAVHKSLSGWLAVLWCQVKPIRLPRGWHCPLKTFTAELQTLFSGLSPGNKCPNFSSGYLILLIHKIPWLFALGVKNVMLLSERVKLWLIPRFEPRTLALHTCDHHSGCWDVSFTFPHLLTFTHLLTNLLHNNPSFDRMCRSGSRHHCNGRHAVCLAITVGIVHPNY